MHSENKSSITPSQTAARLRRAGPLQPRLAFILGSGFHPVLQGVEVAKRIPYPKLPGFPQPSVAGHAGELIVGHLGGSPVLVLSGRSHFYEGHDLARLTFPVRVLAAFGIRDLVLTNAAGGIRRSFRPGDFMLANDHINLMGANPLRGEAIPGLPRFVDLTRVYDEQLGKLMQRAARSCRMALHSGVYLALSGPSYETPAEIRAFARLGADAVGMSSVPEAIVARQCGVNVAAISCITNPAAGRNRTPLSHAEVLQVAERSGARAARLLETFARLYSRLESLSPRPRHKDCH